MDLSSQEKSHLNAQNIAQNQVLNCPVTISVALESVLGSLREYRYQLFAVISLLSIHNRQKSLKPLSMHIIQETRLHRALFFAEGDTQNEVTLTTPSRCHSPSAAWLFPVAPPGALTQVSSHIPSMMKVPSACLSTLIAHPPPLNSSTWKNLSNQEKWP